MKVTITGFVSNGSCEMTNKECECVRVAFQSDSPEATVSIPEFVKQLRFLSRQAEKSGKPAAAGPARSDH